MTKKNRIFICPLGWGLGHAGRIIPLAIKLHELGNQIVIGADKELLQFLKSELPFAEFISFKGFRPRYSGILPQYIALMLQAPILIYHIIKEHYSLSKIVNNISIDIVISDNRFGLWNRKIRSAYITHQPHIPFPEPFHFLEFAGEFLHKAIIKRYNLCFIPDLPGKDNFSGRLSHGHKLPDNIRYIGILSRFSTFKNSNTENKESGNCATVILSGPEPQRRILREKLIKILKTLKIKSVILEGRPGEVRKALEHEGITSISHLPSQQMCELIKTSNPIISRSGYTTIMELASLGKSALLVPTPGQPEQEYLAEYLSEKGWFATVCQENLDKIQEIPEIIPGWQEDITEQSDKLLQQALIELLSIE